MTPLVMISAVLGITSAAPQRFARYNVPDNSISNEEIYDNRICRQIDFATQNYLVRDARDCQKFYSCQPGGTGAWLAYHLTCPGGTVFDGRRCQAGARCKEAGTSITEDKTTTITKATTTTTTEIATTTTVDPTTMFIDVVDTTTEAVDNTTTEEFSSTTTLEPTTIFIDVVDTTTEAVDINTSEEIAITTTTEAVEKEEPAEAVVEFELTTTEEQNVPALISLITGAFEEAVETKTPVSSDSKSSTSPPRTLLVDIVTQNFNNADNIVFDIEELAPVASPEELSQDPLIIYSTEKTVLEVVTEVNP